MKRLFIFFLLCIMMHTAIAQQQQVINSFFEQAGKGNYTAVVQYMAASMQQKINADVFRGIWQQVERDHGKWEGVVSQKIIQNGNPYVVAVSNNFERDVVIFQLALDAGNKIVGFFLTGRKERQPVFNRNETPDTIHTADGGIISGTLVQPEGKPHGPVVLIIAGSGPTDRDGNSSLGLGPNGFSYRQLAEGLAASGIASLRYDKRWIGGSKGFQKEPGNTTLEDFTADAIACVQHLQQSGKFSAVSVIGHSEGGYIGLMMAKEISFKCLIALCTPGECMDKVLLEQLRPKLPDSLYQQAGRILSELREDKTPANIPQQLQLLFNPGNFTFWKSTFRFDPCALLPAAKMPVLIVGGAADVQVTPAEVALLKSCTPGAKMVMINGMTHLLKNSNNISPDNKAPLPLSPELIPPMASFIKQ